MTDTEEQAADDAVLEELKAIHARLMARAIAYDGPDAIPAKAAQSAAAFMVEICADLATLDGENSAVLNVYGNALGGRLEATFCCLPHAIKETAQVANTALERMRTGLAANGIPAGMGEHEETKH